MTSDPTNPERETKTPVTDAREADVFIGCSHHDSGDVQEAYDFARDLDRVANRLADALKLSHASLPDSVPDDCECNVCLTVRALRDFEELRKSK